HLGRVVVPVLPAALAQVRPATVGRLGPASDGDQRVDDDQPPREFLYPLEEVDDVGHVQVIEEAEAEDDVELAVRLAAHKARARARLETLAREQLERLGVELHQYVLRPPLTS